MLISGNAPCPCGSGKKYKRCCLDTEPSTPGTSIANDLAREISSIAEDKGVSSIEDLNKIAAEINNRRNQTPKDDFLGLSPEQMAGLLYSPFTSPGIVSISDQSVPEAQFLSLFDMLVEGIGEPGAKATAKGNLPLKLCQNILSHYESGLSYQPPRIRTEVDFEPLHCVRLVMIQAKLLRKYKGRFQITRKGRELMAPERRGELYLTLLRNYTENFNWAYRDGYAEAQIVQTSFMFTLYMISIAGDKYRHTAFYEELFLNAFPMVVDEMDYDRYTEPEVQASKCYTLRAITRFVCFFGLVEIKSTDKGSRRLFEIKKAPEFDQIFQFHC